MSRIITVTLPDIGEGVVEGEVIEWLKKEGDSLRQDEPVVMVMTDKATVELPAPYPGILAKQYVVPGTLAIRGKPLYDIAVEGDGPQQKESTPQPKASAQATANQSLPPAEPTVNIQHPKSEHRGLATPAIRRIAKELGIDIDEVPGTGKEGRVTEQDLRSNLHTPLHQLSPLPRREGDREEPWIGIRHLMAQKMAESKHMAPHFSYFEQVDATRLVQLRDALKAEGANEGISVSYIPFVIRALSLCIHQFPWINSSIDPDANHLILHQHHHIGIAMSTQQGLIVPIMKNVESLSLEQLIRSFDELKKRAQKNQLHSEDMKGATITISNFGVLGGHGLWATPIINYPEVVILALARIQKQPVVKDNEVVARDMLNLSWSFDHRVIDGHLATQVSSHFCSLISNPAKLL